MKGDQNMYIKKILFMLVVLQCICFSSIFPVKAETADEWVDYGNIYYSQSNYNQAIQYYDAALTIEPYNLRALLNKGNSLYLLGRYSESVDCYNMVLEIDPTNKTANDYKGKALLSISNNPDQQSSPASSHADKLIEPGRIGSLSTGWSPDQVKAVVGEPERIEADQGFFNYLSLFI